MRITKDGNLITSVEEWFKYAPPKGLAEQWVDGRSAKECAKAWFPAPGEPRVPVELEQLWASHPHIGAVSLDEGTPELAVPLDDFPGETRNADMVAWGSCTAGGILVSIEAKADEKFGPTLEEELRLAKSPASNIPKRVNGLCEALLGRPYAAEPRVDHLRYQLFTGCAGALIEAKAKQAALAVFCVHEFLGPSTLPENLERNAADFEGFIRWILPDWSDEIEPGRLIGPIRPRGGGYVSRTIPLYVGKTVRVVDAGSA
jgi:hypothetical protein